MASPDFAIGVNTVHVPSGTAVFPYRALMARVVPTGVLLVHEAVPQFTVVVASKTRDKKVPDSCIGTHPHPVYGHGPPTHVAVTNQWTHIVAGKRDWMSGHYVTVDGKDNIRGVPVDPVAVR